MFDIKNQDLEKQWRYSKMKDRKDWVVKLMEEAFLPADLRCIIKVFSS